VQPSRKDTDPALHRSNGGIILQEREMLIWEEIQSGHEAVESSGTRD
jgi:hypothetical protein